MSKTGGRSKAPKQQSGKSLPEINEEEIVRKALGKVWSDVVGWKYETGERVFVCGDAETGERIDVKMSGLMNWDKLKEEGNSDKAEELLAAIKELEGKAIAEARAEARRVAEEQAEKKKPRRKKKSIQTIKRPRHLVNERLKYYYPENADKQIEIFDNLPRQMMESIRKDDPDSVEAGVFVEGLKLSPAEDKALDALSVMLAEKSSEIKDPKSPGYYEGNAVGEEVLLGIDALSKEEVKTKAPRLRFTPYEWTMAFGGGKVSGGRTVEDAVAVLRGLAKKSSLRIYKVVAWEDDGSRREIKVETYAPMIKLIKCTATKYDKADIETSKREEIIVELDPLFRLQVGGYFVEHNADIVERTIAAYGSERVSSATFKLRDYLIKEKAEGNYSPEMYLDKLNWMLCGGYMKSRNAHKAKKAVEKAIQTVINLGLLREYKVLPGATGKQKVVFHINKKWK